MENVVTVKEGNKKGRRRERKKEENVSGKTKKGRKKLTGKREREGEVRV